MMKRILAMIIVLLLLFCSSCKQDTSLQGDDSIVYAAAGVTYIIDGTNAGSSPATATSKSPWSDGFFESDTALREVTKEALGTLYVGKYEDSCIEKYTSYVTDYYKTDGGIRFGTRGDTGELVYLNLMDDVFFANEPLRTDVENPREYAIERATEIAANWIDVSLYEQEVDVRDSVAQDEDGKALWLNYYITFFKLANGFRTSDFIAIRITSRGTLASVVMGDLGAFHTFENEDCTLNTIENSINATMQGVEKEEKRESQAYEVKEHILALTPDGEYVVCSTLSVTYRDAQTKKNYESSVQMITKFGERATE